MINNSLSKCFIIDQFCFFIFFLAKVIIAGGSDCRGSEATNSIEIIDLVNPKFKCTWVDERAARQAPFGGIIQNKLLLGSNEGIYVNGRRSGVVLDQIRLWVTGGWDEKGNATKTSQFISLDQPPEKGPELPFTVFKHCMVQVDPKTIYLIGGYQNNSGSNKTWIIDPTKNFEIREGQSMNHSRARHSCATMRINNKVFIIVVGNADKRQCRTIEILDTTLPSNNWKFGMY